MRWRGEGPWDTQTAFTSGVNIFARQVLEGAAILNSDSKFVCGSRDCLGSKIRTVTPTKKRVFTGKHSGVYFLLFFTLCFTPVWFWSFCSLRLISRRAFPFEGVVPYVPLHSKHNAASHCKCEKSPCGVPIVSGEEEGWKRQIQPRSSRFNALATIRACTALPSSPHGSVQAFLGQMSLLVPQASSAAYTTSSSTRIQFQDLSGQVSCSHMT